jgi:hypothetical protein
MRLRLVVLACALAGLGAALAPGLVQAAPRHNHHLTIAATPNPVPAGEGVLIYGRLEGPNNAGQTIVLYHHLVGSGLGYTRVGTTTTDSAGFYEFTREEGAVYTNRNWFVRGPQGSHSRTVRERVIALMSINASTTSTDTNHPIVFTGSVTPPIHAFERVFLQQQVGSGDEWRTLTSDVLDANSNYTIAYRWRRPGEHDVRVLFRGDDRNLRGFSDPVTVTIQQAQVPDFTINTSAPITPVGSSVTISGVLDQSATTTAEPNTVVQLWGRTAGEDRFVLLADKPTGQDGSYSFNQGPLTTNTVYYVSTMPMAHVKRRRTARLFQGVQDVLGIQASSTTATVGQTVMFSGTVSPNKAGHVIYLQKRGKDGDFHTVEVGFVRADSTYQFAWTFGAPGSFDFRARITSDGANVGAHSDPVAVTDTAPPASTLPPGS